MREEHKIEHESTVQAGHSDSDGVGPETRRIARAISPDEPSLEASILLMLAAALDYARGNGSRRDAIMFRRQVIAHAQMIAAMDDLGHEIAEEADKSEPDPT